MSADDAPKWELVNEPSGTAPLFQIVGLKLGSHVFAQHIDSVDTARVLKARELSRRLRAAIITTETLTGRKASL